MNRQQYRRSSGGFSLVELLMALMVSSAILAATATLAYAMNAAENETDGIGRNQAVLRHATMKVSERIRFSNAVIAAAADSIQLWSDSDADGVQDADEMSYIEKNAAATQLSLRTAAGTTTLIPACSNIQFVLDQAAPATRFVAVFFDLEDSGTTCRYQISGALLCRPDHM